MAPLATESSYAGSGSGGFHGRDRERYVRRRVEVFVRLPVVYINIAQVTQAPFDRSVGLTASMFLMK